MTRPPPSVLALGYAGLLPPIAGIAARLSGSVPPDAPVVSLLLLGGLLYGGLILSFLGGMWWGAACAVRRGAALQPWLTLAVLPSLIALAALIAAVHAPRVGGALLAIALVASLMVDRRLVQNDMVPDWWMALRVPLSLALAAEMIALAFVL